MKNKALIIDVDRTLITSSNALPSKRVTEAINNLQKQQKTKIILATSKPFNQIRHICEHLHLSDFAVTSGGAEIVDLQTGKAYKEICLSNEKVNETAQIITNFDSQIDFWIQDNGIDRRYNNAYIPEKPFIIVVHHLQEGKAQELLQRLEHISEIFCTKAVPYTEKFIDLNITDENGTKQKSIETILDLLHITKKETIGVGDGYNDLQFLKSCGVKIAMGNAVNSVKEIADYIAPSVDEDGIATVIKKYIL